MNLSVEYKDTSGTISNLNYTLSRLAFVKHMAMAGQGYSIRPAKLLRTIGMFLHYSFYLQRTAFNNDRFSEPPPLLSDPTEKAQFSNIAGKAIADYLSKKIDKSFFTINYEAVMRANNLKLKEKRPDLMAYKKNAMFAIEAKGRVQSSPGDMRKHKRQANSGKIKVNYSIASVSYNLFTSVTCKYHDPINPDVPFDSESLRNASKKYYTALIEFLDNKYFTYREAEYGNEKFYEISLSYGKLHDLFLKDFPHWPFVWMELMDVYNPRLILPLSIHEYSQNGLTKETEAFVFDAEVSKVDESNVYIDTDRVGIRIDRF